MRRQTGFSEWVRHARINSALGESAPPSWRINAAVKEDRFRLRQQSLCAVLRQAGIEHVPVSVMEPPSSLEAGRQALCRLLQDGHRPEIVVCSSDPPAHGVIIEAQQRGLRVPGDLAVMGFGDLDFAAHIHPTLTTVRIDPTRIGCQAAEAILGRLGGEPAGAVIDVGFAIASRDST